MNISERDARTVPELLYLLHSDPAELSEAIRGLRAADLAEALRDLPPDAAAKDVTGLVIYFSVALLLLRGTLL